jgi:signal transduction histidine kinase
MARRAKSVVTPRRTRAEDPQPPLKKRRPAELLFAALDRAQDSAAHVRVRELLHELAVHGEEITAQNEQLKKAQSDLEQARDRYADLYDFAPIGYLSLNRGGSITDVNLAGAALLGQRRLLLSKLPLFAAVHVSYRAPLRAFLKSCWDKPEAPAQLIEIETKSTPSRILRLTCRAQKSGGTARLFTAVVDVTDERRLAIERAVALDRVKALLNRLVTVQEEERRRMARNLHDHLGQQFTALRLTIGSLRDRTIPEPEFAARLERADRLSEAIDKDVDFLAWELRPPALDESGLNAALDQYLREWSAATGIPSELHISAAANMRLRPELDIQVYRIVQEALQNVRKHSNATSVSVLIEQRDEEFVLIVEDDGQGFDAEHVIGRRGELNAMGLISMEERAALLGGSVQIESTPGEGTSVFVRIPITEQP